MDKRKFHIAELCFFLFYFFIIPVLTDVQYYLEFAQLNVSETLGYHLLTDPLLALGYYAYYKWQLPLLFKKRYILFGLSIVVFIIFLEFFLHFIDWYIYHNSLISEKIRLGKKSNLENLLFPRQMIGLTLTHLLLITGFGFFLKKLEDEIILRKLREQHLQLELNYMKAQLQPHFFFNTLNNIYSLALYNSVDTAPTIAKLAHLMRYIIYDGSKKTVPLEKEVEFTRNYIDLEKIRHSDNTSIVFSVQGEPRKMMIEPLLFIPLVENGFKHGITNLPANAWCMVELYISPKAIRILVRNSTDKKYSRNGPGMGLKNLQKRLHLLYPGKHSLVAMDEGTSFMADLKLDLT